MDFKEWFRENGMIYVKGPDGNVVGFVQDRTGKEVAVVNPRKLDASFQLSSDNYVGPHGEGGISGRYDNFKSWFGSDQRNNVEMPSVYFVSDPQTRMRYANEPIAWQVEFENGRHRFAYFRDHGWSELPIQVPVGEKMAFEKRFR